jgi:hypothetical protein
MIAANGNAYAAVDPYDLSGSSIVPGRFSVGARPFVLRPVT